MMFDGQTHVIEFVLYCIEALIFANFYITQIKAQKAQLYQCGTSDWKILMIEG
jgi:hypothetical protein